MKQFTSHLCTFMGRRENLYMLLRYVERALEIGAIDNYWMIDMTRCIEDHEFIYQEQQRLNQLYPGRVHVHNRDTRAEELKDPELIKQSVGSWKPFYQFLSRFGDDDVIAKCDDDTLYFDVETLKAAFEFRWNNKQPYLMHANCINNGITAYHQHQAGVWNTPETDVYPACGLTGPLFSFPEIACEHHKVFTSDLMLNPASVEKYKLHKNISFTQRVSINFIFMLGSDRDSLTTIDLQDEYETSSKKPQQQDRCNCVIGDFVAAHHTYGVQEPVMEKLGTINCYRELADKILKQKHKNKPIHDAYNITTAIRSENGPYLAMHPATDNTCIMKDRKSGLWLSVQGNKKEKIDFTPDRKKVGTGRYMLENIVVGVEQSNQASLLELNLSSGQSLLEFNNSNKLIRTGGSRKEIETHYDPQGKFIPGHMIAKFFHGGYKTELVNFVEQDGGYAIESNTHKGYYLSAKVLKNRNMNLRYIKTDNPDIFEIEPRGEHKNKPVVIDIVRCDDNVMNDGTYYNVITTGEKVYKPREYYWMVDHHVWELQQNLDETYSISLIADNLDQLYLGTQGDTLIMSHKADDWVLDEGYIKHVESGRFLSIRNDQVELGNTPEKFIFQLTK